MSYAWAGGSTREWRRVRRLVLERDGWRCQVGLKGCLVKADCVHHTVGRAVSGDDPAFLVASCRPCNERLGDVSPTDPEPVPRTIW